MRVLGRRASLFRTIYLARDALSVAKPQMGLWLQSRGRENVTICNEKGVCHF